MHTCVCGLCVYYFIYEDILHIHTCQVINSCVGSLLLVKAWTFIGADGTTQQIKILNKTQS